MKLLQINPHRHSNHPVKSCTVTPVDSIWHGGQPVSRACACVCVCVCERWARFHHISLGLSQISWWPTTDYPWCETHSPVCACLIPCWVDLTLVSSDTHPHMRIAGALVTRLWLGGDDSFFYEACGHQITRVIKTCRFIKAVFLRVLPWCRTGNLQVHCGVFCPWWRWTCCYPPDLTAAAGVGAPVLFRGAMMDVSKAFQRFPEALWFTAL